MSQWNGNPEPQQPKKRHTVRNVIIGVFVGMFVVIGGCTAVIGGALSSDTKAPVSVTSKAGTPVDNGPTPEPVTTPTDHYTPTVTVPPKTTAAPETTAPATTEPPAKPAMTASQEQAVGSAQNYLSFKAFSRKGLIQQLSSEYGEGFSVADATFAVDHITVNWNEQAAKAARAYLELGHFSRSGLIQQLESSYGEGFTHRQAVYGVTKAGL